MQILIHLKNKRVGRPKGFIYIYIYTYTYFKLGGGFEPWMSALETSGNAS